MGKRLRFEPLHIARARHAVQQAAQKRKRKQQTIVIVTVGVLVATSLAFLFYAVGQYVNTMLGGVR